MSPELLGQLLAQQTEIVFSTLIDIRFPDTTVWYLCNGKTDIVHNGHTYKASAFTFEPPAVKASTISNSRITVCVVDQRMITAVMEITQAPVLAAHTLVDLNTGAFEHLEEWEFDLTNITWGALTMSADLLFETYLDTEVPSKGFDNVSCPGCY